MRSCLPPLVLFGMHATSRVPLARPRRYLPRCLSDRLRETGEMQRIVIPFTLSAHGHKALHTLLVRPQICAAESGDGFLIPPGSIMSSTLVRE